jgi:hypothetical protein
MNSKYYSETSRTRSRFWLLLASIPMLILIGIAIAKPDRMDAFRLISLIFHVLMLTAIFVLYRNNKSCFWTIHEDAFGVRIAKDNEVLYQGPIEELWIDREEEGVMQMRSKNHDAFLFPRRRTFHPVISRIKTEPKIGVICDYSSKETG